MRLGEILLKRELVTPAAISEALDRQKTIGGRLGANLIALGYLTEEQLSSLLHGAPAAPNGVAATGVPSRDLLSLLLKLMSVEGCETILDLANRIKIAPPSRLLKKARRPQNPSLRPQRSEGPESITH